MFLCMHGFPQLFRSFAETCRRVCVCGWFVILCKLYAFVDVFVLYISQCTVRIIFSRSEICLVCSYWSTDQKKIFQTK